MKSTATESINSAGFSRRIWMVIFALVLLTFLVSGYLFIQWRVAVTDGELRNRVLNQAVEIARTINIQRIKALTFTKADRDLPAFQRMSGNLMLYQTIAGCRGIYTLVLRDGNLVFGPESYAAADPQASPPGTRYRQPPEGIRAIFDNRRALSAGPFADEYGTFIAAYAPVIDPQSGQVLLVVGVDIAAADWQKDLRQVRLTAVFTVLMPALILLTGMLLVWRRSLVAGEPRKWWQQVEVGTVAAFGLALTFVLAFTFHDNEKRSRHKSFQQLAAANVHVLQDAFWDLHDHKLDALIRFFGASQYVDRNEFQIFTAPMLRRLNIEALQWVLPVAQAHKAAWEERGRAEVRSDFTVWQKGAGGQREPVSGRSVYYPVWHSEPGQGNEALLGYDLASVPEHRFALEASVKTDLPTATEPIISDQGSGSRAEIMIFQPLFSPQPPVRTLRGLAVARLCLQRFSQSALPLGSAPDDPLLVEMHQLETSRPPRLLAASATKQTLVDHRSHEGSLVGQDDASVVFPLFLFANTYALLVKPTAAFLTAHPARAGWITVVVGLIITTLLAVFAAFLLSRRADLESQVRVRTDQLGASEENYRDLVEHMHDLVCTHDLEGRIISINQAAVNLLGYERQELIGTDIRDLIAPEVRDEFGRYLETIQKEGAARGLLLVPTNTGERRFWEYDNTLRAEGVSQPVVRGLARDVTEIRKAERTLRESEKRLNQIVEFLPDATFVIDTQGRVTAWNRAMENLSGVPAAEMLGRGGYAYAVPFFGKPRPILIDLVMNFDEEIAGSYAFFEKRQDHLVSESHYEDFRGRGPAWFWNTAGKLYDTKGEVIGAIESIREITDQKLAAAEQHRLEAQLRQAQKMEAVGRLAGGVAHDFNNMLGVMVGYTELALMKIQPGDAISSYLKEIAKATRRSADLVRQLLAFARKQTIVPQVLDLNETVEGMLRMLRRLIGEDIHLIWKPTADPWLVNMDPTQIDQILANLTVNARDAIAGVGNITIETANVLFDEAYCRQHVGSIPGQYLMLAVTDDGCGMDKNTLELLFEPFFTTKPVGKGTGLGLPTVYGIIKQNNGFISVYSEPGQGSTFKVYLPRHGLPAAPPAAEPALVRGPAGHETLLLVEDEPALLEIAEELLTHLGYEVIAAATPGRAIQLAREYPGEIHLLVTDVIMPEMNGRDLAQKILALRPGIKSLFMSGYTADVIAHHDVLNGQIHFLQKPFSLEHLAQKVRQALDS